MGTPLNRSWSTLLVRQEAGVWHVTLNRPECRNAMSLQMVADLRAVLAEVESRADARVIVLRGAGGHFCSGGDIKDMAGMRARLAEGKGDPTAEVNAAFGELCVAYAGTGRAVIAVVEGTVMGGGFGLACVADVVLADPTASFRLPEVSLGVVPAQIAPFLVERLGYSHARRLAVTAACIDASTALSLGLVNEILAPEELAAGLQRAVTAVLGNAPGAVAATKKLMARARLERPADMVQEAAQVFARALYGAEGTEGTAAFMQKRKPAWVPVGR
jgi:isohexenylglutaconyl-CoA hydratase